MREWTERGRRESLTRGLCEHDEFVSTNVFLTVKWYSLILHHIIYNHNWEYESDNGFWECSLRMNIETPFNCRIVTDDE